MIRDVADLLKVFFEFEKQKVESFEMPHMPTLGEAYEEITIQGLNKKYILPNLYDLKIVKGFIKVGEKQLPQQIDCMLVFGEGVQYGLTDQYFYELSNVLAIFEVKKNLSKEALLDALTHLNELKIEFFDSLDEKIENGEISVDFSFFSKHLSYLIGYRLESIADLKRISTKHKMIAYMLLVEMMMPLTIIHGYEGYKRVGDLRNSVKSVIDMLDEANSNRGVRILDFPTLITTNNLGLMKTVATPYWCNFTKPNGFKNWGYMCTYKNNSSLVLLEMIWAKIGMQLNINFPYGDDLINESLFPFFVIEEMREHWTARFIDYNDKRFIDFKNKDAFEFQPIEVSERLADLFNLITMIGGVQIESELINSYLQETNQKKEDFLFLVSDYIFMGVTEIMITPISSWQCVKIGDAYYISNDLDRLTQWIKEKKEPYQIIYTTIHI